ncbi:[protein-PII] uridylyltransferase [Streptomyces sp. N2-109]|uniref:Bifunctional uridylyltransferase/uridylyl-removing enzyme n=1 Tax=Streptomyces gossypii TaxID=2883101 RepID=A0ABT2K285_9ACTN|nr:[protein-PII] uridylyltransferase [Streptomyces gossypii]MCT2594283.1 [protein-PII] uridylyltransferase [Streptomyces gossypii]
MPPRDYAAARRRLLGGSARPGAPRRAELARLTDHWLAGLAGRLPPGVALAATGGYGRGELSPRSDLDLLLLHDGRTPPTGIAALADRIWYPVWDLGLALDHAVRTPAEARATAGEDLKVQLGLLDMRHLAGDTALTTALRTDALANWRAQAARRLPQLHELTRERAERHGELRFLLEPDLKEARGGLRDATALRAVAASWLADAPREGLEEARRTLLDVRDALQLATGRATDRLSLQDQDQVAADLALPDADALLQRVYEAARTLSYASEVTWREVGRVVRGRSGRQRLRGMLPGRRGATAAARQERAPLAEGVVEHAGEAALARSARPERDPVLPLRAAAAAARAGLPLTMATVHRLARTAPPLPVPWPAEAREEFVTLLGAGRAMVPVWEALDAAGLVTALLPGWERVRCRPQRNAVHLWTVDRHMVETAVRAAAFTRRVRRPDLLLVAALLHDIGKGRPGDHSEAGAGVARELATRIGFGPADVEVLGTLVRHHLLLVETATRRDLDDPATVRSVADAVGEFGALELLHALTEADALATGPAAWSNWRAALVGDLVKRVGAVLGGDTLPAEADGTDRDDHFLPAVEAERLALEAWRLDGPALALRLRPQPRRTPGAEPQTGAGGGAEEGTGAGEPAGARLVVALRDRPGVLPAVAGILALHRLTVRTAQLRHLPLPLEVTGLDPASAPPSQPPPSSPSSAPYGASVLLLSWHVAAEYGALPPAHRLRADLVRVLDGTLDVAARLAEREAAYRGPGRHGASAPPPRVTVADTGSRLATVLEVRAQDASGLLFRVGRALERAGVTVRSAYVSTLGANAVDAFYVTGPTGAPLPCADAADLARELERALGR